MLVLQFSHLFFELTTIVILKCPGINKRSNLVNVSDHGGYVCSLFCSQRSGYFISGSSIDSREDTLVLIPM